MEEVLEKLETTLISQDSTDDKKSNFEGLFKNWGRLGNQEERRREILETQKSNRNDRLDKFRGILELVNAVEDNIFHSYNKTFYRPNIYVAGFNKTSLTYRNVLMMSEWLIEKPEDFNENWVVVPCPTGVRMLVVASKGTTKCYTKYGQFRFECRTALPGGNPCDSKHKNQCCVLDCFYQEKNNTMYVLDLLAWNNQTMTDGETEFRHFWLKTKFSELPDLKYENKKNNLVFTIIPMVSCNKESFNTFMNTYPAFECNFPPLDGLLFYHNKVQYVSGETPLVGWLYPYMVQEVLGSDITVHESYNEKPPGYVNQADFIQKFEEKMAKKGRNRLSTNSMDTSESESPPSKQSQGKNNSKSKTSGIHVSEMTKDQADPSNSLHENEKKTEAGEMDIVEASHSQKSEDQCAQKAKVGEMDVAENPADATSTNKTKDGQPKDSSIDGDPTNGGENLNKISEMETVACTVKAD